MKSWVVLWIFSAFVMGDSPDVEDDEWSIAFNALPDGEENDSDDGWGHALDKAGGTPGCSADEEWTVHVDGFEEESSADEWGSKLASIGGDDDPALRVQDIKSRSDVKAYVDRLRHGISGPSPKVSIPETIKELSDVIAHAMEGSEGGQASWAAPWLDPRLDGFMEKERNDIVFDARMQHVAPEAAEYGSSKEAINQNGSDTAAGTVLM